MTAGIEAKGVTFEPVRIDGRVSPIVRVSIVLSSKIDEASLRTARVVQERAELKQSQLRIPAADEAMKPKLEELRPALGDKSLRSCK